MLGKSGTEYRIPILLVVVFILLMLFFPSEAFAKGTAQITSKEQLNRKGIKIAIGEGSAAILIAEKELPLAEIVYVDAVQGYESVAQGKVDAYIFDRRQMQLAMDNGLKGVRILDEGLDERVHVAAGLSPKSGIPELEEKINSFIAEAKADGTLDEMYRRWVLDRNEEMPKIKLPESPKYHLTVGTTGVVPPYSYYKGDILTGYDIELARRFAAWLDADLSLKVYNYGAIITAAASGDIDCIMADLNITSERAEKIPFSDDLFAEEMAIMVRDDGGVIPEYSGFSELSGRRVSMLTGAPFEELVKSRAPGVTDFTYYNNTADILMAVKAKKTDALLTNNAIAMLAVNRDPGLALFPEELKDGVFGFAFHKGDPDRQRWQEAYDRIPKERIEEAWEKWTGFDESKKVLPKQDWPGKNGTVKAAVCDTLEPMSYSGKDGELVGFDLELILLMAKELDVHVEFTGMEFSSVLAYVESGKALLGAGSIIVTDERREAVDFIEYYPAAFVLVVRSVQADNKDGSFLSGIRSSFERTFIKENRWKLFLSGFFVTVMITVLSVILGTALGFLVYLLCRDGNRAANHITDICLWLVQGTPVVVLLMILYYIVFANASIGGVAVSVICFTLTFGASVYGLLKMGVGTVDRGQYEAAYALGFSRNRTFFRIILPQALPHVMDAYRGEIAGLIKATAIVGYIAVQDLTKAVDIVRSRNYEAFFPLIAVTVIYFLLEGLMGAMVKGIKTCTDPKKRKHKGLLKGVVSHDQDRAS